MLAIHLLECCASILHCSRLVCIQSAHLCLIPMDLIFLLLVLLVLPVLLLLRRYIYTYRFLFFVFSSSLFFCFFAFFRSFSFVTFSIFPTRFEATLNLSIFITKLTTHLWQAITMNVLIRLDRCSFCTFRKEKLYTLSHRFLFQIICMHFNGIRNFISNCNFIPSFCLVCVSVFYLFV